VVMATQPASRFINTGVDVVTLEQTPWSIALAEQIKQTGQSKIIREEQLAVRQHAAPIKILAIGILARADPTITAHTRSIAEDPLLQRVLATEHALIVHPFQEPDTVFADARTHGMHTMVGVPLTVRSGIRGFLRLESTEEEACTAAEMAMLERIAGALVVVLENARLFRQAATRHKILEEAARRQEVLLQTILELSSPITTIVPGILVMPLIGTIDTRRANQIIDTLLQHIAAQHAQIVLIEISGVPVVDTGVANYLIQAAQAARLLGAEVVLVGITPAVAQTIVQLGIDLDQIASRADLQSGFTYALARLKGRIIYTNQQQPAG